MRCEVSTLPPATDAGGFAFTTARRDHFDRLDEPGTRRHFAINQTTKDITHRRHCNRFDRIDRANNLRRAPAEIDHRAFTFDGYPDADRHRAILDTVVVQSTFRFVRAGGD